MLMDGEVPFLRIDNYKIVIILYNELFHNTNSLSRTKQSIFFPTRTHKYNIFHLNLCYLKIIVIINKKAVLFHMQYVRVLERSRRS